MEKSRAEFAREAGAMGVTRGRKLGRASTPASAATLTFPMTVTVMRGE